MQAEVLASNPSARIRILAIDEAGDAPAAALAVEGRTIPLLEDTPTASVQAAWNAAQHDVVILDAENNAIGLYGLTVHNLSYAPDYAVLLDYLRFAAGE